MKLFFKILLLFLFFILLSNQIVKAGDINFAITPIKYEIEGKRGEILNKTATLYNKTDKTLYITTAKSNFESKNTLGNPIFVRKEDLTNPSQELADWITINTNSFSIAPKEEKSITFSINIPNDASPGGHYGAIFFQNKNTDNNPSDELSINVDYGVLILVNVDGDIVIDGEIDGINIISDSGGWGNIKDLKEDSCILGDFSGDKYDGKCFDLSNNGVTNSGVLNNNFNIKFEIPFKNKGNTHIKPKGKIILIDENGNKLKGIGRKIIENDTGVIIGEQIVDYIPINDNGGNVLPNSDRKFDYDWKGFLIIGLDKNGEKIIKDISPSDYYSKLNLGDITILKPRQEIKERNKRKKIKAISEISYDGVDGKDIEFKSADEFYITYKEKYIGCNTFFIYFLIFLILILIILIFIIFKLKNILTKKKKKQKKKKNNKKKRYK